MNQFRTISIFPTILPALVIAGAVFGASVALGDGLEAELGAPPPLSTLVRFDDRAYQISYDDTISLEPTAEVSVTKIGYGRETIVNIVTTASGTYSSDGLASPHVLYPGITVDPVAQRAFDLEFRFGLGGGRRGAGGGSSFLNLMASEDGDFVYAETSGGSASCHILGSFLHCFGS